MNVGTILMRVLPLASASPCIMPAKVLGGAAYEAIAQGLKSTAVIT
jgi:hypothetical protein